MAALLSDSESADSDSGIRFKTTSTRNKNITFATSSHMSTNRFDDRMTDNWNRSRDDSSRYSNSNERKSYRRSSRSESRERRRHRSRSRERYKSRGTSDRKRSHSKDRSGNRRSVDKEKSFSTNKTSSSKVLNKTPDIKPTSPSFSSANAVDAIDISRNDDKDIIHRKSSKHKKHKKSKHTDKRNLNESSNKYKSSPIVNSFTDNKIKSSSISSTSSSSKSTTIDTTAIKVGDDIKKYDEFDQNLVCGPSLPPNFNKSTSSSFTITTNSINATAIESRIIGPSLPSSSNITDYLHKVDDPTSAMSDISESNSDDLEIIGPLPVDMLPVSESQLKLEKRALELKLARLNNDDSNDTHRHDKKEREDWMIELPDIKQVTDLGLGSRKFRTKERADYSDRSSWTDKPSDKSHRKHSKSKELTREQIKINQQKESERILNAKRDLEQEQSVKRHKKKHKRDESLLEIHQRKLKQKRKEDTGMIPTRRPFDRDTDLKVNRFDQNQKNSIIKKAQLLDTRFSRGEIKYL